jgi:RNA-directed DNA polymerase
MIEKTEFRDVFESFFHGNESFDEFLNIELVANVAGRIIDHRQVYVPNAKLRTFLSFLNLAVVRHLVFAKDSVYSYRQDKTVRDSVERHSHSRYFFQTDIESFFPSINKSLIRSSLLRSRQFFPFHDLDIYEERIADYVTVNGVLQPGFPTSNVLSNAALYEFDQVYFDYCDKRGLAFTRYSDDIVVSGSNLEVVTAAAKALSIFLLDLYGKNFSLNRSKTKFNKIGRKIKILGMNVLANGAVTVDNQFKIKLETLLYAYMSDSVKFMKLTNNNAKAGAAKVSGYLSYINSVDQDYLQKLRNKYGISLIENLLKHRQEP